MGIPVSVSGATDRRVAQRKAGVERHLTTEDLFHADGAELSVDDEPVDEHPPIPATLMDTARETISEQQSTSAVIAAS